jgi:hypothetical protein
MGCGSGEEIGPVPVHGKDESTSRVGILCPFWVLLRRFNYILIDGLEMIRVIARGTYSPYQDKNMPRSYMFKMLTEGRIHHDFAVRHN